MRKLPFIGGRANDAKCFGNHCGSLVSKTLNAMGASPSPLSPMDTLPSTALLDKGVKILGVTNKPLIQRQLLRAAGHRSVLGLGMAGLMGAAGYGAGAVGNMLKAPPAKPMPTLDPKLFAQATKLLAPQSRLS